MHVPMPFVPSICSAHTPPSQMPQFSKAEAIAASPRWSMTTPSVLQKNTA
jgi:hypothetical protein